MKPRSKKSYNEHDLADIDCASEFGEVINDFDYIDYEALAEVDDDDFWV